MVRAPVGAVAQDFGPPMRSAELRAFTKTRLDPSPAHGSRLFLVVAAVLAAAWLAVLALLAIFTGESRDAQRGAGRGVPLRHHGDRHWRPGEGPGHRRA